MEQVSRDNKTNKDIMSDLFLHFVYEYRCLVSAGYAYKSLGDKPDEPIGEGGKVLVEADRIIQDSIHLHARELVDFYTARKSRDTDSNIVDFGSELVKSNELDLIKKTIEKFALHLTTHRNFVIDGKIVDPDTAHPNWFTYNLEIVDRLLEQLHEVSEKLPDVKYRLAFCELYKVAKNRFKLGNLYSWPVELDDKPPQMRKWLDSLQ